MRAGVQAARLARQAKAALGPAGSRDSPPATASAELLEQLMASVLAGDEERTLSLVHPEVVLISDAGPARRAARHPIAGAERVRQLLEGSWRLIAFKNRASPDERPPHASLRSTRALRSCWTRPRGQS
jgi:hypothetical protein